MTRLLAAAALLVAAPVLAAEEGGHGDGGGGTSLISPAFGMMFWTLVTFVILLVVLRLVAWKPLLGAVEERERRIQGNIDEARQQRNEAETLLAEHRKLMDDVRRQTAEIVTQGQKDAARLVDEAQGKATYPAAAGMDEANSRAQQLAREATAELAPYGDRASILLQLTDYLLRRSN